MSLLFGKTYSDHPGMGRALLALLLMGGAAPGMAAETGSSQVIERFTFTDSPDADASDTLRDQGYEFKLDAEGLDLQFSGDGLVLETDSQRAGLIAREVNIEDVDRVRITWGVNEYPEGADWAAGVYRVPIAVMISFGDKEIDSGSMFVPDVPYFVGLFLGEKEQEGHAYKANYYHEGGRYFCQPCNPEPGETITTVFNFDEVLTEQFDISTSMPVSSVGIQMNTNDTQGSAKAFIQEIEFLSDGESSDRIVKSDQDER
ncbi:hypothetical protein J2T55_000438 [Methylohalomonas lacus]|uniref:DUF3047 domain-containing protein n=1 Tax=Methylohalomonas lacus TaxID=398773 RepID=A0AAE3L4Z7_9GAMM|nr:hypothetical protein [Methylohalomonas lacus]MCS3902442.1 hypothetical protein [Methylohalomonas lacus]